MTDDRRRRLRHLSRTGDSQPDDRKHRDWTRERLERMDARFRTAVERAIANGEETAPGERQSVARC